MAIIEQAFMNVNLKVPATGDKKEWNATSAIQGQRVRIERRGVKNAGGEWNRASMINLVLKVGKDVSPTARKLLSNITSNYKDVITMVDKEDACPPGKPAAVKKTDTKNKGKPATAKKTVTKKPAGRS